MLPAFRTAALAVCAMAPIHALELPAVDFEASPVVDLAGTWRFQPGDDAGWASPDFDDSGWPSLRAPGSWARQGYPDVRLAWYRKRVALPRVTAVSWAVTVGKVDSAYELFAGGERLGGVGALPPTPQAEYDRHRTYAIPAHAVSDDGTLTLALRVWRAPYKGPSGAGAVSGPFLLGPAAELSRREALAETPDLLLVALFWISTLYHLRLSLIRPHSAEYLWFGLLSFQVGLYCLLGTQWKYAMTDEFLLLKKTEHLLLYLVPPTLLQFLAPLVEARIGAGLRAFQLGLLSGGAAVLLAPGLGLALGLLPWLQAAFAFFSLRMIALLAQRFRAGNAEARRLLPSVAVLSAALVHDALVERAFLHTPRLGKWAFALVVGAMAIVLADRFARTLRDLDGLRRELEARVEERTRELAEANRRLDHIARHDALTGLLARRATEERAREELQRAARTGRAFSLVLLDVDRFKSVNDRHGHPVGDLVLQAVGRALAATLRGYDAVGRWGGEEFVAALPETSPGPAAAIAERLRAAIAELHLDGDHASAVRVTASLGVCGRERATARDSFEDLMREADAALYRAKGDGRNAVRVAGVD